MSLTAYITDTNADSFPRLRGDEPDHLVLHERAEEFSPPTRG